MIRTACITLVLISSALVTSTALAGQADDGVRAYLNGDYDKALALLQPSAEEGEQKAQYWLGTMYFEGRGVPRDYEKASLWFRRAAEQRNALAQRMLGTMLADGKGIPQNYEEAMQWYRRAAEQGDASAQFSVGELYGAGRGVPQDHTEATKWYRLAAEQGYAPAQFNVGLAFASGHGVPKDIVLAHSWFSIAARRFSPDEKERRAEAERNRDELEARMTGDEVAEAQRRAREWTPKRSTADGGPGR